MPQAIVLAATEISALAADVAVASGASFATINAVSAFAYSAATIGITTGLSYGIGLALQPKVPKPSATQIPLKQAIPPRVSGWGRARVSGTYLLYTARGKTSVNVLAAIECGDRPIAGWRRFWLNDDEVFLDGAFGVIAAHGTRYGEITPGPIPRVYFYTSTGQGTETAFAGIISAASDMWTSAHRGDHIACFGLTALQGKLNDQPGLFPNGDPSPSAAGDLSPTYDPRLNGIDSQGSPGAWPFNRNPVLALLDYLATSDRGGVGLDYAKRIRPNVDSWITAANVCDEAVPVSDAETHITANAAIGGHELTLYGVQGLDVGISITLNRATATQEIRTVSAIAGNVVTVGSALTYAHSIGEPVEWQVGGTGVEARYAFGGTYSWETDPAEVIGQLLACFDGWLGQAPDGSLICRAGRYEEPTVIFDDAVVLGYTVAGRPVDEEAVNQLHLTYTDPDRAYNDADAGDWDDAADQARRGKARAQPLNLPWVQSSSQTRRLAKRLMGRLVAPLRGTVTVNLYSILALGERYVRLRIQENPLLRDLPVEITAGPKIDLKALTLTFPWTEADTDIDSWSTAEEQVQVRATPTIEPPTNTAFSESVFDAAAAAIVAGSGAGVTVDALAQTITISVPGGPYVQNLGAAPSLQAGLHSARPAAAGNTNAIFIETDTKKIFRSNGSTWDAIGSAGSSTTISDTAPSSPAAGDLWFNSKDDADGGRGKIWYVGASSSAWIDFNPAIPGPQGIQGPAGATGGTQAIDFIWPGHL
jgi:hypothetical protein